MMYASWSPGEVADELESGTWIKGLDYYDNEADSYCIFGVIACLATGFVGHLIVDDSFGIQWLTSAAERASEVAAPWVWTAGLGPLNEDTEGWEEIIAHLRSMQSQIDEALQERRVA